MEDAIKGKTHVLRAGAREERAASKTRLLERIDSPADLKSLSVAELESLAAEIRAFILQVVSQKGGHFASSLGTVELTLALYHLYDLPKDKVIWDVGHQAYVHKILTGRRDAMWTIRQHKGVSGFLRRAESEYDIFGAGHASTGISAAMGFATARDLKHENHHVVAVLGDGALTGGLAYEALNNAGHSERNLLVVLNDNAMSISPNVGAISHYLTSLTAHPYYKKMKDEIQQLLTKVPAVVGEPATKLAQMMGSGIKSTLVPGALFQALGFHYYGPIDGHDMTELVSVIGNLKEVPGPILLHVLTHKGKGYSYAESDPDGYHGMTPFNIETGKKNPVKPSPPSYTQVFGQTMIDLARERKDVVAITAAMLGGTGLEAFQEEFPDRCFDVGIAEGHGVTFAGGLAAEGLRPVAAIYSTFLQRAFDHTIHDVCLQNLPVVFCMDRGGLAGADGPTHHGAFDLSYMRLIPNMVVASPRDGNEMRDLMLTGVLHTSGPFGLRYPRETVPGDYDPSRAPKAIPVGVWEELSGPEDLVFVATGTMVEECRAAIRILEQEGLSAGLVNGRWIKPVDTAMLRRLSGRCRWIVTVEENTLLGGFGDAVYECFRAEGLDTAKLRHMGMPDRFVEHGSRTELLDEIGLSAAHIAAKARELLNIPPPPSSRPPETTGGAGA
jgi:1-deoxy-D-xylulose-5-phosphate synthase